MAELVIRGGKKLKGAIEVGGGKNSVLKGIAASLLFAGPIRISNIPLIEDVRRMTELLEGLGAGVTENSRILKIDPGALKGHKLDNNIAKSIRASIVLAGPLLARERRAVFPHPGGDVIGKRPIDLFLEGLEAMGAKIRANKNGYEARAERLKGADFTFRTISVTGTETLMMSAVLAKGRTILRNAAMEPEVEHLASFLNKCGARIKGAGTSTIEIAGRAGRLLNKRGTFVTLPDRIDAGSFLILGAALGRNVKVKKCVPGHMHALLQLFKAASIPYKIGQDWISVSRPRTIYATDVKTQEYPGFATDLQPLFAVLMTQAKGQSLIFETVHDGRLNYIEELNRMGAKIFPADPHRILVSGPTFLHGREIQSPDIRAGMAFIIAALVAKGESRIKNIYQIDRGYEKIEERLTKLGADIRRI